MTLYHGQGHGLSVWIHNKTDLYGITYSYWEQTVCFVDLKSRAKQREALTEPQRNLARGPYSSYYLTG